MSINLSQGLQGKPQLLRLWQLKRTHSTGKHLLRHLQVEDCPAASFVSHPSALVDKVWSVALEHLRCRSLVLATVAGLLPICTCLESAECAWPVHAVVVLGPELVAAKLHRIELT